MKNNTKIITCSCEKGFVANLVSPGVTYQDARYGKNKRVANSTKIDGEYRCTVCGRTTSVKSEEEKVKK